MTSTHFPKLLARHWKLPLDITDERSRQIVQFLQEYDDMFSRCGTKESGWALHWHRAESSDATRSSSSSPCTFGRNWQSSKRMLITDSWIPSTLSSTCERSRLVIYPGLSRNPIRIRQPLLPVMADCDVRTIWTWCFGDWRTRPV